MTKKTQFQNIVNEIRQALGHSASYREILDCASLIFNTFESEKLDGEIIRESSASLDQMEIHDIWEKDPWQIYWQEPIEDRDVEHGFQINHAIFN